MTGTLYVVSAPSGAGKTSLIRALLQSAENVVMSVSHTTRVQRENEREGVDYHFVKEPEFKALIAEDCFLEYACVFKCYYGTSKQWVLDQLHAGLDVILEIDWQGAQQIRALMPESVSIYILPPSLEALQARLINRQQDDQKTIDYRMSEAKKESLHYREYDYLLINDEFNSTLRALDSIIMARRCRTVVQVEKHKQLILSLLGVNPLESEV